MEAFLDACKDVCLQIQAQQAKYSYMFIPRQQNATQEYNTIKI
jgi:hypothetical protein